MAKMVAAVLWDFAWTLMAPEPAGRWLARGLAEAGVRVRAEEQAAWAAKAAHAGFPGPATPRRDLTPDQLAAWRHRALGPEIHEAVYRGLLERAGLPWPQAAQALYRRHMAADGWQRYPDAVHVLKRLTTAGVACGVVSNIGWDIRVPLDSAGLLPYLGTVVCSYEEGVRKPDPALFAIACERLGVDPARTLMVGDSPRADSGGEPLGIRTVLVSPQPPDRRPAGLLPVLAAAQLC
ncbi:HAD family hydrolase [Streptomyces botrytidirepellens]|uniref:HAD family hydrolase n=2 Tax=Streptomyces botrytidirepellens TaxID=2486417 RepID=A0A3M8WWT2_9ACTN|nr:HAD family hydrolase [Streptomyces botrytidirepellens]